MKFIVGIGNPGKEYEKTRHNVGFGVAEILAKKKLAGVEIIKPKTFVNRTGQAVLNKKIEAKDLLVVCDDVNLALGKMRLRAKGSDGGHNGLKSVIDAFGSLEFARLRVGVGQEIMPKDLTGFVLGKFSKSEEKELETVLEKAASVCETWAADGFNAALNVLSRLQSNV